MRKARAMAVIAMTLAVLTLAGCQSGGPGVGQPGSQTSGEVEVPEYGWDTALDEVIAELDQAGAEYSSSDDWIEIEDGTLFGLDAYTVELNFQDGQLVAVSGYLIEDEETCIDAIRSALGAPAEDFRQIMSQLSDDGPKAYENEAMDGYVWISANTLADNLSPEALEQYRSIYTEDYDETQMASREETEDDGTRVWYGEAAIDAFLSNPSSYCLCEKYNDWQVTVQRYDLLFENMIL